MTLYNLTVGTNNTGLDTVMQNLSANVQVLGMSFGFMLIIFEFLIITIMGTYAQKRTIGYSAVLQWAMVGSFISSFSAIVLYTIPNILSLTEMSITISITLVITLAYFFSDRQDD